MATYEHILYENKGPVALITLNRPERLNAWTQTMEMEFIDAINAASADPEVGCIVITGAGRGFCAGADISGWDRGIKQGAPAAPRSKMLWRAAARKCPSRSSAPSRPSAPSTASASASASR